MTPIKIILIILLVIVLRAFLVQSSLILFQRLVASLMFCFLLLLVVFPNISTSVANAIGVGRGVDLVFYFSHLFLLLLIVGLWRRYKVLMVTITRLSRAIALQNPNQPYRKNDQADPKA
jgi:hypothetical protein